MVKFLDPKERIIVPIDTQNLDTALSTVELLHEHVGMFKFGLELLNSILVQLVLGGETERKQAEKLFALTSGRLFWDGKWDDIPNTVGGAAAAVAKLKPVMVNVHVSAGVDAIVKAVKKSPGSKVLGVTVLTSLGKEDSTSIFGDPPYKKTVKFAKMIVDAGAHGIICSPIELPLLAEFSKLIKVTPGVRPLWSEKHDQKRVMTPRMAIDEGADYLVIGRPITDPPTIIGGPIEAVKKIVEEIGG